MKAAAAKLGVNLFSFPKVVLKDHTILELCITGAGLVIAHKRQLPVRKPGG